VPHNPKNNPCAKNSHLHLLSINQVKEELSHSLTSEKILTEVCTLIPAAFIVSAFTAHLNYCSLLPFSASALASPHHNTTPLTRRFYRRSGYKCNILALLQNWQQSARHDKYLMRKSSLSIRQETPLKRHEREITDQKEREFGMSGVFYDISKTTPFPRLLPTLATLEKMAAGGWKTLKASLKDIQKSNAWPPAHSFLCFQSRCVKL